VNADGVVQQANEGELAAANLQQAVQSLLAAP